MKILLTGATGYIGKRLIPALLENGHTIIACVRDSSRFTLQPEWKGSVSVFEVDFLKEVNTKKAPLDFDIAYYLIHSMSASISDFHEKETRAAKNFAAFLNQSNAKQIIYLTGIVDKGQNLSKHLSSRLNVEQILGKCKVPLTALRAGIIIGSGSASFEIIRDIVEKLPVMITPKWLNTRCQPIGIRNVLQFLTKILGKEKYYNQHFDISCGETLTYKEMLLGYAKVRKLKRYIITLPIMTPRLSSYWLYFITSTSYNLAVNLVDSMKIDVVGKENNLASELNIELISYIQSVQLAFSIIEKNTITSSWKDSYISSLEKDTLSEYVKVPNFGCFTDHKEIQITNNSPKQVLNNLWAIGGKRGWYFANLLWKLRGYLDKLVGGIGLRRGRTNPHQIHVGDALDFWRVLVADRKEMRLLLFAEMKLPGEAWLEFNIEKKGAVHVLQQTATFRPHGIWGRLYWYSVLPFHWLIFGRMIRNIEKFKK